MTWYIHPEGNPAGFDDLDATGGHYAKWNKSDRERWILPNITNVWNLKKIQQTSG